ncbi:MAG: bifunctional folylpolyglutamate synthase/dihydrofolate synthase [Candidatus Omnitrophica bacterium]|nr:bifunctional folylpolyglutamate synthase/dihydrofolate synthase [Candidatus Omnitrophota bacterium]MDD5311147.1 bifunctional folylpolyglutamate synthase/dihydrofolate synthase [Candidatus Omnitrophota bacterium]MDD5546906.1 bifunctional folylpolyglutamate synthase/dihydrofolate synthase [Candidatus Omnitrophota bacterium]
MTYQEALKYLDSFIDYEKRAAFDYRAAMRLGRMRALLDGLGNPQRNFRSIHIAGTKGKGSTCAFVYSILKEGGIRAGLYTSPHLLDFKERIRISFPKERNIEEAEVAALVARIKKFLDNFSKSSRFGPPSFFEVYTALAFLFFSIKKTNIAVIEVGMGGRLDATNTLDPLAVGISPVSLDHTDRLGETVEAIAKEKCGIIKENSTVVSAEQEPAVLNCIRKAAADRKAKLYLVGKDISYETLTASPEEQTFNVRGLYGEYALLTTPLLGRHQAANAAAAIGLIESLRARGITICSHNITGGIRNVNWPGRLQVVSRAPWIILDGAQNEASARALKEALGGIFAYKKLYLVFGVSSGKDIKGMARNLFPLADEIFFTKADTPRAISPDKIRKGFPDYEKRSVATFNVKEAVELARRHAGEEDLILVTGSLFVAGEALRCLGRKGVPYEKTA